MACAASFLTLTAFVEARLISYWLDFGLGPIRLARGSTQAQSLYVAVDSPAGSSQDLNHEVGDGTCVSLQRVASRSESLQAVSMRRIVRRLLGRLQTH